MTQLFDRHLKGDRTIWMVMLILSVVSALAVYSAVSSLAYKSEAAGPGHFLLKHVGFLSIGLVLAYYAHRLRAGIYSRLAQLTIGLTAALLLLTLISGTNLNDASRWLRIPVIGLSFQTSDLAKLVLVLYVARVIGKRKQEPWTFRAVILELMLPIGLICGLILPANFSTAALLFAVCMVVLFVGGVPIKWLFASVGLAAGAFLLLVTVNEAAGLDLLPRVETWQARFTNHRSGDSEANFQVEHAKIAIASGGLLPNGPGSGTSRNFLPHPYSDMIYAFIVEEYGSLLGGLGMLLLYLILMERVVRIASRSPRTFGALAAMGLGFSLVLQAMVNMAVAVNLVPVTGQPLPLVSMGGTSVLFTSLAIGIILSVSRTIEEERTEPARDERATTTDA